LGFDSEEYESMQDFFNKEIKKNDAKLVLSNIDKFFKDIKNIKLKKYLIDALTKHVTFSHLLHHLLRKHWTLSTLAAWYSQYARKKIMERNWLSSLRYSLDSLTLLKSNI
jgi:hypothetical protein